VIRRTGFRAAFSFVVIGGCLAGYTARWSSSRSQHQIHGSDAKLAIQAPICGRPDDGQVHIPLGWTSFEPPAAGKSYVDPVFGCLIRRLTNSGIDETLPDGTHVGFTGYYSTFSPINASDTMLLIVSTDGAWRVKSTDGSVVLPPGKMPAMNNGHPVWDASHGDVFYYTLGNSLYKARIGRGSVKKTVLHTFEEYRGIVSPDAADLSQDGDHLALVGQNPNDTMDVFVWSLAQQAKTSIYTTTCRINQWSVAQSPQPGCIHKLQLTPNNLLAIEFANDGAGEEQGVRLWNGHDLTHLQDRTNHLDTGFDLKGKPVFIESGNSSYTPGATNPCPGGWGLDVRQLNEVSSSTCLLDKLPNWHVSYRGSASQPWAALSFFDDRKTGPELFTINKSFQAPSLSNWRLYEDEIMLARVDGGATYRLAHARSRSAENYWATPRAAISRDGEYVVFTSNMAYPNGCPAKMHAATECLDVYLIKVN
jgi:hypothetical protein